jgi:ABC-type branched-subunit amino acid transport system ATPase component
MTHLQDDLHLQVRDLTAGYGGRSVIRNVGFVIRRGGLCLIEGGNGAGKSTLLRCIIGLIPAWSGSILLGDQDMTKSPTSDRVRAGICMVPQGGLVLRDLTTAENLEFVTHKRGRASVLDSLAEYPGLLSRKALLAGRLSGGERQQLSLAMAMALEPRVLLLDEPSIGLSTEALGSLVYRLRILREAGTSVVVTESYPDWLQEDADTFVSLEYDQAQAGTLNHS